MGHPKSNQSDVYGALDLGTNNCRLLIAKQDQNRPIGSKSQFISSPDYRIIDAFSRIVRLGEGLEKKQRLSENAMDRTVQALGVCARKMKQRNVTHQWCVTTEACRRADNCQEFLDRVVDKTGIELSLISGQEEATLGLIGCLSLLNPAKSHAIIFDIGGGSTEISWLKISSLGSFQVMGWVSMPFGVVTLTERFDAQMDRFKPGGGDLQAQDYQEIVKEVTHHIRGFDQANGISPMIEQNQVQIIGTSGTVTTLAGIHKRMPRYDRNQIDGSTLYRNQIFSLIQELKSCSNAGRATYPCIGLQRADLVMSGCAVLDAICNQWPVEMLTIADRGLREGILHKLMHPEETESILENCTLT